MQNSTAHLVEGVEGVIGKLLNVLVFCMEMPLLFYIRVETCFILSILLVILKLFISKFVRHF